MSDGAVKYDDCKVAVFRGAVGRFPLALQEVAKVSTYGCNKYSVPLGDMNFLDVPDGFMRYTDAVARHLMQEVADGPVNAEDGGVLHAAQVAWNALARLEIYLRNRAGAETTARPPFGCKSQLGCVDAAGCAGEAKCNLLI